MAGYTYTTFTQALALALVTSTSVAKFSEFLPTIIQNAELRCLRDVDFMATRRYEYSTFSGALPAATRAIIGGPSDLVIIRSFGYYTPAGTTSDDGDWESLIRVDETFIREYWPNRGTTGAPKYYAERNIPTGGVAQILVAPTPANTNRIEMGLTFRPASLSSGNPTTWLSENAPDLLFAAAMVVGAAYQRNFGAQASDPKMALSWENTYQVAKQQCLVDEIRRKSEGYADVSQSQPPAQTPPAL